VDIAQSEADYLMQLEKFFESDDPIELGVISLKCCHPLISIDGRERFLLDIWRGGISLKKYRLQERARSVIILVRLDISGAPHINPDGKTITCPHIHIYREGFDDKWAFPLEDFPFGDLKDIVTTFYDFTKFCNISNTPVVQRRLA